MLEIRCDADVAHAGGWARRVAARHGFGRRASWEIAVAVSEAASNIVKYGRRGSIALRFAAAEGWLEIEALDEGDGIADVELAEQDGVSEGGHRADARDLRAVRGLGLGLGAIRRMTDELVIQRRNGRGTRLVARKRRPA